MEEKQEAQAPMMVIPWYQSPVFVQLVVSFVSQIVALLGYSDVFPDEKINLLVSTFAQMVAFASLAYAGWKRAKSPVQPLAVSRKAAETRNTVEIPPGGG